MVMDLTTNPTIFGLPRSHWHCHLSNFNWEAVKPPLLQTHLLQFLEAAAVGKDPHLILTGQPGLGKTHLGVAAYRSMVSHVGTLLATWLNVPAFCDRVKASYAEGCDPFLDYSEAKRFVVLDDLFGRDLTAHEAGQIVYRLIDTAYQNGAAVLVTMNQDIKELPARLPRHEISRLLAHATIIHVQGTQDWRQHQ